uniref:Uncharacterized protein n=1 Tax=Tetradesmus obliquus TaxID=3088 RepID=A0A383VFH7_TETOB|eukprot:jgi/Sobl393_1/19006/SZX64277.1
MTFQPDIINGIPRFLVMLASAGVFNMTLLAVGATTSRHMLQSITVVPGVVHAYSSFIQGPTTLTAGSLAVLQLNLRDEWSNPIPAQSEHAHAVDVVVIPPCHCIVRVNIEDAVLNVSTKLNHPGLFQIYISVNKDPVRAFPYLISVVPNSTQWSNPGSIIEEPSTHYLPNCSGHGTWANGYCTCHAGWMTDTNIWVGGSISWCNSIHAADAPEPKGSRTNALLALVLATCSIALLSSLAALAYTKIIV